MTALNAILRPEAAYLISDGEAWDGFLGQQGCEAVPRPKVLPLPHLNAAIGVRGCSALLPVLYSRIVHNRTSFEDAAAHLGDDLRDTVTRMRAKMPDLADHDVILVGWPLLANRPVCFVVCDHAKWGLEPFQVASSSGIVGPNDGSLLSRMNNVNFLRDDSPFDPETDAVSLIMAQHQMPGAFVGGFAQVTAVYRDRIETRVIELPDDEEAPPVSRREELNAFMAGS